MAPQDTLDTATARMAGYIVDSPTYARMPLLAFRNSGCQSLLALGIFKLVRRYEFSRMAFWAKK